MKSVVVDTNVVLSFVTDRDPHQQRAGARLFEHAASGEHRIILPQVVLIEIVYVFQNLYRTPAAKIAGLLDDLLGMPHVVVENEVPWHAVLEIWPKRLRDFADAVLMTVARTGGHKVASIGVAVRRWVTWHGVALNVCTDLSWFGRFDPCGMEPDVMTTLESELGGAAPPMAEVKSSLAARMAETLRG